MPTSQANTDLINFEFETFGEPKLEEMVSAANAFCRAAEAPGCLRGHWLTLLGRSGIGKTHLATKIYDRVRRKRECERIITPERHSSFLIRKIKWRTFVDEIMSGNWSITSWLIEPHFLYLDEFGDEAKGTREIVFSKFGNVCDARLGKWTLFTGNQSYTNIAETDARIASRMLRQGNVIIDAGDKVQDYALRMMKARGGMQ